MLMRLPNNPNYENTSPKDIFTQNLNLIQRMKTYHDLSLTVNEDLTHPLSVTSLITFKFF